MSLAVKASPGGLEEEASAVPGAVGWWVGRKGLRLKKDWMEGNGGAICSNSGWRREKGRGYWMGGGVEVVV